MYNNIMRINCMCYVYGMRESTGKYTEVWQRLGSELESSSSLLPTLRGIAASVNLLLANLGSFSPRKSERRFAAIAPATALVSC